MQDSEPTARQVADLEDRLEELELMVERCRKIDRAAKAGAIAGLLLLLATIFGLAGAGAASFALAAGLSIGALVLYGSNRSTLLAVRAQIRALEQARSELIDSLPMRSVDGANQDDWRLSPPGP